MGTSKENKDEHELEKLRGENSVAEDDKEGRFSESLLIWNKTSGQNWQAFVWLASLDECYTCSCRVMGSLALQLVEVKCAVVNIVQTYIRILQYCIENCVNIESN